MGKYNIGDKVKIREDLQLGEIYGNQHVNQTMLRYRGEYGEIVAIVDVGYEDHYLLKGVSYVWSESMFEPVEEELTFKEVIAKIKPGEVYKCTGEDCRLKSIEWVDGKKYLRFIGRFINNVEVITSDKFKKVQIKEKVKIVGVEHNPNGSRYDFIAEGQVIVGNFVVCNTKRGDVYGRVVSSCYKELTKEEINQYKTCKAF